MRSTSIKMLLFCLIASFFSLGTNGCPGCPPHRERLYEPVSIQLNLQICREQSYFDARGLQALVWQGRLLSSHSGAREGRESFERRFATAQAPIGTPTPSGYSWFQHTEENLKAGRWEIVAGYSAPVDSGGAGGYEEASGNIELLDSGNVYLTQGIREVRSGETPDFPDCP